MISKLDILSVKYKYLYNSLLFLNKNNKKVIDYKTQGFENLKEKVNDLPQDIAFMPSLFTKRSTCLKIKDKSYIFLSKYNLKKPVESMFDALYHEIGHWLHFKQMPPKEERQHIWKNSGVSLEKIEAEVSKRATEDDDGKEFVAEVFKGTVKGEKYDADIMYLYYLLNGPVVK